MLLNIFQCIKQLSVTKNHTVPNVYSCEIEKLCLSLVCNQDIPMMLCSLWEGRKENGFLIRSDGQLEDRTSHHPSFSFSHRAFFDFWQKERIFDSA